MSSDIDEETLHIKLISSLDKAEPIEKSLKQHAENLSVKKADYVSKRHNGSMIIGVDQVGWCGNKMLKKPENKEHLNSILVDMQGLWHHLYCHISVILNGNLIWGYGSIASLKMRSMRQKTITQFIEENPICYGCLGGYKFEGKGKLLFSEYKGDYFTILGLPLIPLLNFLQKKDI